MLRALPPVTDPRVLSGPGGRADAAVYRLADDLALVQSVDLITPVVDDPYCFGQIAAANALSDLYAVGARPITALNVVGFPVETFPLSVLEAILRGGAEMVQAAGASVVGGHTIDDLEPKYGLAVAGLAHPDRVVTNAGARPGDRLVLTKPLGLGVITTAIDRRLASPASAERAVEVMVTLNRGASAAMARVGVSACTDVTGFGLIGHLHQLAGASGVAVRIAFERVPVLEAAWPLAARGCFPAGTERNRRDLAHSVRWAAPLAPHEELVLCDAQTSGGLLIAVPAERTAALLDALAAERVPVVAEIGEVVQAAPEEVGRVTVTRS